MDAGTASRSSSGLVLAMAMAGPGLACSVAGSPLEQECVVERIHYGSDRSTLLQLGPARRAALVAVFSAERETICSGTVVADGVVVTARHCAEAPIDRLRVGEWTSGGIEAPVRSAILHPDLDVGVLFVDASALSDELEPIPLFEGHMDAAWLGHPVELAGHGLTELDEIGGLHFAAEPIHAIESDSIVVHGQGRSGACGGDSGGPLLARDDAGRIRVVGVLDSGHPSCVWDDRYTRVDVLADWWPFDWRRSASEVLDCEGLDADGVCVRGRVMSCHADGRIRVETCEGEHVCGQRSGDSAFACVSPGEDVCEGAGSLPWCVDGLVVSCVGGAQVVVDCSTCGSTCVDWTPAGGAGCMIASEDAGPHVL